MLESLRAPLLFAEMKYRPSSANAVFGWVCTKHLALAATHFSSFYAGMRAMAHTQFVDKAGSGGHNKKASLEL
jgi:hypothetical protein